jgi:replication-associated recombination protein RarA
VVHRFSRSQQGALLGAVDDQMVLLVAVTATENPFFSGVAPLRSRSAVLQLHRYAMTACERLSAVFWPIRAISEVWSP